MEASMNTIVATLKLSTFAGLLAPFRRSRVLHKIERTPRMDSATYAAMAAEAERIAAPYRQHVAQQLAMLQAPADEPGGEFPDVEALFARAGLNRG
jgi:hypothetical protein